ncbi:MAG TPA: vitamin K epoxide reductase family protein [Candidatus Limnocylindrales bacterium]|nr:vitamin K epoxide reductase family protein [Candidatus Limnocylindrales bacterium]
MPKLKKPRATLPTQALPRPDRIIVGLALLGLAVAGYLPALKLAGNPAFLCRDGSGCDIVQASRYSLLAGVPTALWGACLYAAVLVLSLVPQTARRWQTAFMLVSAAVAFSIYLTYVSIVVIGATCPYCLVSGGIALLLLVTMVVRRPGAPAGSARAYGLKRLATLGSTAGMAAVLLGAFIFAADISTPAGYQEALAKHLARSKAVFYGAYW